jgi:hypothetical protein
MRDKRFVAVHRGGTLTKDNHRKLAGWARRCSEHVFPLIEGNIDGRLIHALQVVIKWEKGIAKTGEAMKASVNAHAVARESCDPQYIAIARSVGHAVATAHMADHSPGAALYALKAVKCAGKSIIKEREWQFKQLQDLPPEIVEIIVHSIKMKEKALKLN